MWCTEQRGKYKYTERYKDFNTGKFFTISVTFPADNVKNRKKAAEKLQQLYTERGGRRKNEDTFGSLADQYIAWQSTHVRESTMLKNKRMIKKLLELLGRDTLIVRLSAGYVRERIPDCNPSTYNELIARLKALLRWAYEFDKIDSIDWLIKLKPISTDYKERIADKYMEKEELKTLLERMAVERWRLLTKFLCLSGLRIGEAIALDNKDVDLKGRFIHVHKNWMVEVRKMEYMTKTAAGMRDVYIQDELLPVVKNINSYVNGLKKRGGFHNDIFFPGKNGSRLDYDTYNKYLRENTEFILGRRLTPHACRHTMVSLMAEQGVPLAVISRRLGHADSKVTKNIYLHNTSGQKLKDIESVSQIRVLG